MNILEHFGFPSVEEVYNRITQDHSFIDEKIKVPNMAVDFRTIDMRSFGSVSGGRPSWSSGPESPLYTEEDKLIINSYFHLRSLLFSLCKLQDIHEEFSLLWDGPRKQIHGRTDIMFRPRGSSNDVFASDAPSSIDGSYVFKQTQGIRLDLEIMDIAIDIREKLGALTILHGRDIFAKEPSAPNYSAETFKEE